MNQPTPAGSSFPSVIARDLLLILVAGAVVCFSFLGSDVNWGSHETRHAVIAARMAETGDFLVPELLGAPYPDKPPVMHAAIAALFLISGRVSMFLARVPSALAGMIGAVALYGLGTVLSNRRTGLFAGLAILGTFGYVRLARIARPDMVFVAALLVACWGLAGGLKGRVRRRRGAWLALGGFAAGLAALTKGPYGLIFPVLFLVLALVGRPDFGRPRGVEWLVLLGAFLVAPSAWAVPVYLRDQGHYLASVLTQRDLVTMVGVLARPFYWYLGTAPLYLLPFTVFLPWVIRDLHRDSVAAFLAGAILVVLSCVPGKRENYLGPWYPFAVLAVAAALANRAGQRWLWRTAWAVLVLALLAVPVYCGIAQTCWRTKPNDERLLAERITQVVPEGARLLFFKAREEPESVAYILYEQRRPHVIAVARCRDADELRMAATADERTGRPWYLAVREKEMKLALSILPRHRAQPVFAAEVDGQRWSLLMVGPQR